MPTIVVEDGIFGYGKYRLRPGKFETDDDALVKAIVDSNLDWAYVLDEDGRVLRDTPPSFDVDSPAVAPRESTTQPSAPPEVLSTQDFFGAEQKAAAANVRPEPVAVTEPPHPASPDVKKTKEKKRWH